MLGLSEKDVSDSDTVKATMDEFLRWKQEIDSRTSLTISQLYSIAFASVLTILVLGLAGLYFLGLFWGAIFASVFFRSCDIDHDGQNEKQ
jgi:hypothetical protein